MKQGINASGSSSASLTFTHYYTGTGDTLTKTAATSSNTFNLSAASTKYVIEISASHLTDPKDYIAVAIATPGANADYYAVMIELYNPRYALGAASPTAIT